ncbi:MAG TPA: glycosyltransferase family 2 protein [Allocoleopsis sp.]
MCSYPPRISIGMPVYNGERFIREALDSILAQTFKDFEVIISDNASTDGTQDICESYAQRDERVHYYRHEQNRGAAWNFNYVVQAARGEYFKWAAHDDFCAPTFLEGCLKVLDNNPTAVLCQSKTIFTKTDGQFWWEGRSLAQLDSEQPSERFQAALAAFWCLEVFGLLRHDALKKTSLIAPYYGSDKLLLVELSLMGRFKEIPEPLFFRRCHAEQSSRLSAREREIWIDPKAALRFQVPQHRGSLRYLWAIVRTPLNWEERTRCFAILIRYVASAKTWRKFFIKNTPTKV